MYTAFFYTAVHNQIVPIKIFARGFSAARTGAHDGILCTNEHFFLKTTMSLSRSQGHLASAIFGTEIMPLDRWLKQVKHHEKDAADKGEAYLTAIPIESIPTSAHLSALVEVEQYARRPLEIIVKRNTSLTAPPDATIAGGYVARMLAPIMRHGSAGMPEAADVDGVSSGGAQCYAAELDDDEQPEYADIDVFVPPLYADDCWLSSWQEKAYLVVRQNACITVVAPNNGSRTQQIVVHECASDPRALVKMFDMVHVQAWISGNVGFASAEAVSAWRNMVTGEPVGASYKLRPSRQGKAAAEGFAYCSTADRRSLRGMSDASRDVSLLQLWQWSKAASQKKIDIMRKMAAALEDARRGGLREGECDLVSALLNRFIGTEDADDRPRFEAHASVSDALMDASRYLRDNKREFGFSRDYAAAPMHPEA